MKDKIVQFFKTFILKKKCIYILCFLIGFFWLFFIDSYNIKDYLEYRQKINDLKEEIDYYEREIERCNKEMHELESNREGLEQFAREQYLMKREDEDIFLFE